MVFIVYVMHIINAEDFSDAKSGFRNQQDEQLISAVGTGLQYFNDFFMLGGSDPSVLLPSGIP